MGNTLGNGKLNEIMIEFLNDKTLCPVEGLFKYAKGAKEMGIDLKSA